MKIQAQEYQARVDALRAKMAENGVDVVVGFSNLLEIAIVRYYCGFAPTNESSAIVIPAEGEVIVCSGQASYDDCQLKNELPNSRIAILPEIGEVSGFVYDTEGQLDFEDLFRQVKAEHPGIKKVGFIGRLIFPAIIMDKLRKVFPDCEVVDMDDIHYEQRIMKSPAEVELMTKNWEMVSEVFKNVIPKIKVGMTETQVAGLALGKMHELGAERESYPLWVLTGDGSDQAISRPRHKVIEKGDLTFIQIGARFGGYASTIGRPVVFGKATDEQKNLIMAGYKIQETMIASLRAGRPAREVALLHKQLVNELGYGDYYLYGPFHGNGLMEGEAPWIETDSTYDLEENMTFCADIFLGNHEKKHGLRIEDVVRVTRDGAENLTNSPRELFEL